MTSEIAVVFVLATLFAGPARAQDDSDYRAAIDGAVAEMNAAHYAEALALFQRAHERYPNARTLRGIGLAYFELRDYVRAAAALAGSLDHSERPLTAAMRREVTEFLERSRQFTGTLRIRVTPPDATITLGGEPVTLDETGRVTLNSGQVEVAAVAEGHRSGGARPTIRPGQETEVVLVLAPIDEDAPTAPERVPPQPELHTQPMPAPVDEEESSGLALALSLVGDVLALAGLGVSLAWLLIEQSESRACAAALDDVHRGCTNGASIDNAILGAWIAVAGSSVLAAGFGVASIAFAF